MVNEIHRMHKKASAKTKAILRTCRFYDTAGLIQQFKSHVLCILEGSNAAIYHAAVSHLALLDHLQQSFVHNIGLNEETAFLTHNLAPLALRRDISILGLLHKINLGIAHPDFRKLFPADECARRLTRHNELRHSLQFQETFGKTNYYNRSIFAAVRVYNVLPEHAVSLKSIQEFQSYLTAMA